MQIHDRVKSGFLKCCPGSENLQQGIFKTNIGKISDVKERNPLHANLPVSGVRQSAWYTHTLETPIFGLLPGFLIINCSVSQIQLIYRQSHHTQCFRSQLCAKGQEPFSFYEFRALLS